MSAHNDWINTLETDHDRRMMYSGSKDGIVKVWKLKNKQLKCSA
jgi:WD40 repeat protein